MSRLSIKVLTSAVLLAASFNLVSQFYRMHREAVELQESYEQSGITVCKFGPSFDEASRLYIQFFLILAFLGSWLKDFKHTLLSVVGLTGVTIFYVFWWQHYFWLEEVLDSERPLGNHVAYLYGAGYLDILIAAAVALLILLHLRLAVQSIPSNKRS